MEIPKGKHLGVLCKNGHNWNGTGKSLRNNKCECYECNKIYQRKYQQYHTEYYGECFKKISNDRLSIYFKKLRKENIQFKLSSNISCSIWESIKEYKCGHHWETLVGYTLNELKRHLEKQFTDGMTWENYGEWHIDHIIPKSAFNFSSPEHIDFKRCWALSNLQPLWAKENFSKSNKLKRAFQPCLAL